jgi:hypothetical protein|tara:strand:- start:5710 stop:6216 length:507 start_codon:yes stop_codon:yes gene_type:complete
MSDFADVKFDFEASDDSKSYIPEGDYTCRISECEKTLSQAGNEYLKLVVQVEGDKYNNWIIRENYNLWYTNSDSSKQDMVREIASRNFAKLLKALGLQDNPPSNATELVGRKVICNLGIEESNNPDYGDKNKIVEFKQVEGMRAVTAEAPPAWVTEGTEASKPAKPSL